MVAVTNIGRKSEMVGLRSTGGSSTTNIRVGFRCFAGTAIRQSTTTEHVRTIEGGTDETTATQDCSVSTLTNREVEVCEIVNIPGAFGKSMNNMLNVEMKLSFDVPPAMFTPGMSMIVEQQLHQAVTRMIEKAKKLK